MMAELQPNLFEAGLRRLPDFGHTFSPAIEEASDYLVPHGEAVAFDMLLSGCHCGAPPPFAARNAREADRPFSRSGTAVLPPACELSMLARALESARLQRGGVLAMVLPVRLGEGCLPTRSPPTSSATRS